MTAAAEAVAPRVSMVMIAAHPSGGSLVGVVAKRTYRVAAQRCFVADDQLPLVEQPRFSDDRAILLHDLDCVLNRREVDVVLEGHARPARARAPSFQMRVRVGSLDRKLAVFGERRCYRAASGRLQFSAPEPIEAVPLDWTSSYGGFDSVALAGHGDPLLQLREQAKQPYSPRFGRFAYPRNRAGKGYLIEPTDDALAACALPNVEEPLALLSPERLAVGAHDRWPAAPTVAAVGWLSYASFPRAAMLGIPPVYDAAACPPASFFEVRMGVLKADSLAAAIPFPNRLDLRVAQQAALGMRLPLLAAGAPVSVVNAHPAIPVWEFTLPREVPTLVVQMPGSKPARLEPKIRTVHIQPEHDRLSLVWVGELDEPVFVGPNKRALIKHAIEWRT
ncbi:MAG TPA: DUF2169 domain-containing protein [Polyangia bacterium]|nr:DUF2169 domain-containing protein [Polyangia bacterium]